MSTSIQPFAYESRDYLRNLLIGKEVTFTVEYTVQASGREYGVVQLPGNIIVNQELVKEGYAKARPQKTSGDQEGES
jgi:staphylococcal nuclease domain-containing protein 1